MDDTIVGAREVAFADALDLYDFGAEVGKVPAAERRRDGLLEADYPNAR